MDKERNTMSEDPKWQGKRNIIVFQFSEYQKNWFSPKQSWFVNPNWSENGNYLFSTSPDTAYILAHYKTEACKRPPRLCRQGYACPHFHNIRDKRRNPRIYKYRFLNILFLNKSNMFQIIIDES